MCIRDSDEADPRMTEQFDNVLQAAVHLRTLIQDMLNLRYVCLLYTSDAADERSSVDLGGRRIIKKKQRTYHDRSPEQEETQTSYSTHRTQYRTNAHT